MADTQQTAAEIQINVKGPSELKLQITISTDKTVLDLKQAIAEKSDVPADRQRLIYSGRVLKDEDGLSVYKIQNSHTVHMVKGVSRSAGSTSQPAAPPPLPTMHTGLIPSDPLTQLNGHRGFGAMAGFNPFSQMGVNTNDPNMMQGMLQNPEFLQQMSTIMADPAIIEQLIASDPRLAAMGPRVRELFQSEGFRQMMTNPDSLRMMLQMSNAMGGGLGGAGAGAGSFPAPGLPGGGSIPPAGSPGASAGAAPPLFNPWFPPAPQSSGAPAPSAATDTPGAAPAAGAGAPPNPFASLFDPNAMQQMLGMLGGGPGLGGLGGAGLGGFGGAGGFGGPPAAPADSRPPEERFQVQLQQLQDMGFTNAQQNVRALLATGGNVHSAIEYILGGGGL